MLRYIKFDADGFGRDVISVDSPKTEGIEGHRFLRGGKSRRNPTTIVLAKFFPQCHCGFDRVSAGCRARNQLVRKGAVND